MNELQKPLRYAIATIVGSIALSYTIGVMAGVVPEGQRIDAAHLAFIVVTSLVITLLVAPQVFERIQQVEASGFKVQLDRVKETQNKQEATLSDMWMMLPLVLPWNERAHLFNLLDNKTANYKGSRALRDEIRSLRSMGLVEMCQGKHAGDVRSGITFDLADFVQLTDRGRDWAMQIRNIQPETSTELQETHPPGT